MSENEKVGLFVFGLFFGRFLLDPIVFSVLFSAVLLVLVWVAFLSVLEKLCNLIHKDLFEWICDTSKTIWEWFFGIVCFFHLLLLFSLPLVCLVCLFWDLGECLFLYFSE
jgi:hypothetical protein